jgi:hypothetical protein
LRGLDDGLTGIAVQVLRRDGHSGADKSRSQHRRSNNTTYTHGTNPFSCSELLKADASRHLCERPRRSSGGAVNY